MWITKVVQMTVGVDITGPRSKTTQYKADILFDTYWMPCNAPNIGFNTRKVLMSWGNATIKASFMIKNLKDFVIEEVLNFQKAILKSLVIIFRINITVIFIWADRDGDARILKWPVESTRRARYGTICYWDTRRSYHRVFVDTAQFVDYGNWDAWNEQQRFIGLEQSYTILQGQSVGLR